MCFVVNEFICVKGAAEGHKNSNPGRLFVIYIESCWVEGAGQEL
jgi:hypothetical protein